MVLKLNILKDKEVSNVWWFQRANWENKGYKKLILYVPVEYNVFIVYNLSLLI